MYSSSGIDLCRGELRAAILATGRSNRYSVVCALYDHRASRDRKDRTDQNPAGTLHCFFEGYFIINHAHMASAQDLFGQLWKEYALSDSRYMTSDTVVLCMETMTVVSEYLSPGECISGHTQLHD